ncbi:MULTISPECIES: helix-turn-helix domain-containing protein [Streptomycetaceae]|uniref:helix-turn-helix domain-containing protein n=1 Tax=Streptomycetaceae TaxID=2062 RepID=UPI0003729EE2|nr:MULTISPECIES: helix-turn-helix domain-containing protein [Streptomycetaceae]MDX2850662.1 helix-turn-helix domain-containing protein [Streptomyces sp. PA03-3a]MYX37697.1 helix-turn-helix domain-containing protein [Streptomyces sp. SID8377]
MERDWLSVEQVADRLGLHVRTVRGYIRDGRLKAVRIGKQYRVARTDLDALTGAPAAAARHRVEVSAIVEVDGIGAAAADRLGTLLVAGAQMARDPHELARVRTAYDDERSRLKVVVLGGAAATADVLRTIDDVMGGENDMFPEERTEHPEAGRD